MHFGRIFWTSLLHMIADSRQAFLDYLQLVSDHFGLQRFVQSQTSQKTINDI